ncbi:hypothetical protein NC651_034597 [Populus alba x Populus x berolinensis]|nr:hypothetical protein NC651_034597 [Populus alba x Populus x berolinensis]
MGSCLVIKRGEKLVAFVGNTLLDMYAKSGSIEDARKFLIAHAAFWMKDSFTSTQEVNYNVERQDYTLCHTWLIFLVEFLTS